MESPAEPRAAPRAVPPFAVVVRKGPAGAPALAQPGPPPVPDDALADFPTEEEVRTRAARKTVRSTRLAWCASAVAILGIIGALAWPKFRMLLSSEASPPAVATGTLSVESSPPGAAVAIDGRERGTTPLTIPVPAGRHRIVLTGASSKKELDVAVSAGAQVVHHVELAEVPATGRVAVASRPPGAAVLLDGVPRGTTPVELDGVEAGDHQVTVANRSASVTHQVRVTAGGTASLVVPLVSAAPAGPSWISIVAPIELQVFEDGALIGTSRSQRIMVLPGSHRLRLSNPALGFETTEDVQAGPGGVTALRVSVPDGILNVNAVPWAEVLLDGRRVGETPIANLAVPIGPHELVLRHPKYPEQRRSVVVTASGPVRVGVDLRQ